MIAVVVVSAAFALVGFSMLRRVALADLGLALLLGAGVVGSLVFLATIVGASAGYVTFAVAAIVAAAIPLRVPRPPAQRVGIAEGVLATALGAVALLGVVGGFRSSPWLDDAWGLWLAKGTMLATRGLDARVFSPSNEFVAFEVPDYPLWWAAVSALDVRASGFDLRAMNAQLAVLAVAFLGAALRLLWGRVRPWVALGAVLLVAVSPEFWRHAQGGGADLPLAIYVALAVLCAALWLARDETHLLVLAAVFGAVALQIKTEALPELVVLALVGFAAAHGRRARFALAAAAALATAVPWQIWRAVHDVPSRLPLGDALDPARLADRSERLWPSVRTVTGHVVDPTEWALIVPLALVAIVLRRDIPAAAALVSLWGFLVFVYWADRD
ncbi:MAG TPA: hypothetical protein VE444_08095, partial [Gaiellaceae bacterium]|nr:hypothetical protein [Gaiellaceae bacterium]